MKRLVLFLLGISSIFLGTANAATSTMYITNLTSYNMSINDSMLMCTNGEGAWVSRGLPPNVRAYGITGASSEWIHYKYGSCTITLTMGEDEIQINGNFSNSASGDLISEFTASYTGPVPINICGSSPLGASYYNCTAETGAQIILDPRNNLKEYPMYGASFSVLPTPAKQ